MTSQDKIWLCDLCGTGRDNPIEDMICANPGCISNIFNSPVHATFRQMSEQPSLGGNLGEEMRKEFETFLNYGPDFKGDEREEEHAWNAFQSAAAARDAKIKELESQLETERTLLEHANLKNAELQKENKTFSNAVGVINELCAKTIGELSALQLRNQQLQADAGAKSNTLFMCQQMMEEICNGCKHHIENPKLLQTPKHSLLCESIKSALSGIAGKSFLEKMKRMEKALENIAYGQYSFTFSKVAREALSESSEGRKNV